MTRQSCGGLRANSITVDPCKTDRLLIPPIFHYRLANLYAAKGRAKEAIEQYQKFLAITIEADIYQAEIADAKARWQPLPPDELLEFLLREMIRDAELLGLRELGARFGARDDVARLGAHARARAAAERLARGARPPRA